MDSKKVKILFLIICTLQVLYLFHFRSGFKFDLFINPFNETSGVAYALAPEIIESNNLLKKYEANDFNLSQKLKEDTYFYQRSIEFNYPFRLSEDSRLTFFLLKDDVPSKCKLIESGNYIKLIEC